MSSPEKTQTALKILEGRSVQIGKRISELEASLSDLEKSCSDLSKMVELANMCLEDRLKDKEVLEEAVSGALQKAFGQNYRFVFEPTTFGGSPGIVPTVVHPSGFSDSVRDGFGGGNQNIVSLLLKLIALSSCEGTNRCHIADEPLANLEGYWDSFSEYLQTFCLEHGLQYIHVTNSEAFGRIFSVEESDGVSFIRLETPS